MIILVLGAATLSAQAAQARVHHQHHVVHLHHAAASRLAMGGRYHSTGRRYRTTEAATYAAEPGAANYAANGDPASGGWSSDARGGTARSGYHGGYGARPSAWCGWEMRHLVSGDPGPSYNLARNWAHWGHGGAPGVGAVVVWAHHVGKIVGRSGGEWVVEFGNDGHALRTRTRSIAGAIAFRWG